jgi:hypothetical protein
MNFTQNQMWKQELWVNKIGQKAPLTATFSVSSNQTCCTMGGWWEIQDWEIQWDDWGSVFKLCPANSAVSQCPISLDMDFTYKWGKKPKEHISDKIRKWMTQYSANFLLTILALFRLPFSASSALNLNVRFQTEESTHTGPPNKLETKTCETGPNGEAVAQPTPMVSTRESGLDCQIFCLPK